MITQANMLSLNTETIICNSLPKKKHLRDRDMKTTPYSSWNIKTRLKYFPRWDTLYHTVLTYSAKDTSDTVRLDTVNISSRHRKTPCDHLETMRTVTPDCKGRSDCYVTNIWKPGFTHLRMRAFPGTPRTSHDKDFSSRVIFKLSYEILFILFFFCFK